ncbi:hypothetical protein, conserved [Babesia ovata]|uniref:C3H1-type domain-containing protein n=1 Tax=Babesia ovata TaxID=189622 RepID=A0A2H6KK36_9APIC|nr:uncharacterized protein BOVATA_048490 [Babesia ovata]GBE63356.1 hypothetical protein, conserved [Babesia ovata]
MSFLHGVLHNIHGHLGQHKETLNSALNSLKDTNLNGITKYRAAIAAVAGGVRTYNERVAASNDAVKKVITDLHKYTQSDSKLRVFLNNLQTAHNRRDTGYQLAKDEVDKKLQECQEQAKKFTDSLDTSNTKNKLNDSFNDLNDSLRVTLSHVRSTVEYEAKRLETVKAAKAAEFSDTEEKITATLKSMKISVDCKIDAQIRELISKLRERVQKILDELRGIDKRFREYYNALQEWIIKAEKVVDEAHGEVNRLLGHINNTSTTYPMQITSRAEQLERDVEGLYNAGQAATEKVKAEVKIALAAVKSLETAVKYDLHTVRGQINEKIGEYVRNTVSNVMDAAKEANTNWSDTDNTKFPGITELKLKLKEGELGTLVKDLSDTRDAAGYALENFLDWLKITYNLKTAVPADTSKLTNALETDLTKELNNQLPDVNGQQRVRLDNLTVSFANGKGNGNTGSRQALDDAITKIQTDVTGALGSIEGVKDGALADLRNVKDNIRKLCEVIKKDAGDDKGEVDDTLRGRLNDLKKRYFEVYEEEKKNGEKSIKKIQKQFGVLHMDLVSKPIKDAEAFITFCSEAETYFTKELKDQVDKDVQKAKTEIICHARKQYVDAIKDLLTKFAEKVQSELQPLPQELRDDLEQGHKGFVDKLGRYFILQIRDFFPTRIVPPEQRKTLKDFADILRLRFNDFVVALCDQADFKKNVNVFFEPSRQALHRLLTDLIRSEHFDRTFNTNIDNFNNVLHNFAPKNFSGPCSPLLDALNAGLNRLGTELNKAYVSAYDGEKPTDGWVTEVTETSKSSDVASPKYKFTDEGEKCAKVCATLLSTLYTKLSDLRQRCKNGVRNGFNKDTINKTTRLGRFFDGEGFVVSDPDDQNGELQHKKGFTGQNIYEKLTVQHTDQTQKHYKLVSDEDDKDPVTGKQEKPDVKTTAQKYSVLKDFVGHLHQYFSVNHYATSFSTKHPSSINDMLQWLSGLPHNHIFTKLPHHVKTLFDRPKEREHEDYSAFQPNELKLDATVPLSAETIIKELGMSSWGSDWHCNAKQCPNQMAHQKCPQQGDQKCNQHPKCGLKSPLQSFLEDGLQGFLPHPYNKSDCKMTCSLANHRGIACKTPMGFTDISHVASRKSTAKRLKDVLSLFCGRAGAPLTKLCSQLNCLLPTAPKTLGDMFAFYYSFITTWGDKGRQHKKDAFDLAVQKAHFERPYGDLDVYSIFKGSHSAKTAGHTDGDLLSLVCSTQSPGKCGLYLSSLSNDISATFSAKHGDKYLSWIVYMTETFYDLLKKLFDECNGSCGGDRPRCRIANCPPTCTVAKQPSTSSHSDPCKSLVNCKTTHPTLCKYGFTINSPPKLGGKDDPALKRTCHDLCTILEKIVKEGSVLYNLVHKTIPKYLFEIRSKFIWTLLALWSLSLLYLLHIAVVRLDVLRIRSHLRSPASHRVAAQSLLAAARVKALANVKYFSP